MSDITPNIRPLADRIVVKAQDAETKTAGGIVIPDSAGREKEMRGTVKAVGNGKYIDGKLQPLQIKVGDEIIFGKYAGTAVKLDSGEFLIMREEDVLGVIV